MQNDSTAYGRLIRMMTDSQLSAERDRVHELVSMTVASVHGIISDSLSAKYVAIDEEIERRGWNPTF